MKPTLRQRRILRKLTTLMDKPTYENGQLVNTPKGMGRYIGMCSIRGGHIVRVNSRYESFEVDELTTHTPKPSFLRYLFNRNGFGRWRWWEFALIELACALFIVWGTVLNDGGAFGIVWPALVNVVVVYWHWRQYRKIP